MCRARCAHQANSRSRHTPPSGTRCQGAIPKCPSSPAPLRARPPFPPVQCSAPRRLRCPAPHRSPGQPRPDARGRCARYSPRGWDTAVKHHVRCRPRLGAACVLASCQPRRRARRPFDTSAVLAWDRSRLGPPVAASSRLCVLPLTQWPWPQVWGASWGTDTYVDRWRPHRRYSTSELCCLSPPLPLEHLFLIVLLPHCRFRRRSPPFPTPPPPSPPSVTTW
mgnify:CR=1 FL=1